MGTTATGIQQKAWVAVESSFNTIAAMVATDAFDFNEMSIGSSPAYTQVSSHIGTASLQDEIRGKVEHSFEVQFDLRPEAAGTEPDAGAFYQAAFGAKTVGGTVSYDPSDSDDIVTLQVVRYTGDNLCEWVNGLGISSIAFEVSNSEPVRVTASGRFASYGYLYGGATVAGSEPISETAIVLGSGEAKKVGVNALVKFATEDNGGAGYRVTAVNTDTDTITISPGLAAGLSGGEAVAPVVPSQTLGSGRSIGAADHDLSIGGTSVGFISASITVETGHTPIENEATSKTITGWVRGGRRNVTAETEFYFKNENNEIAGGRELGDFVQAWNFRLGENVSGERAKINMPAVRGTVEQISVPDAEQATFSASGVARQNAAAGDEIQLLLD